MSNSPVDSRVRLAIARWPADAPRGAVKAFCVEQGISRKTFYELRRRVLAEGEAAVLLPRSRRPHSSPTKVREEVVEQALQVRAALAASGLDHGPISVHDKLLSLGMEAPSIASLARIFRRRGVARVEPRKKPRSAYRRFVFPAPNACWQLDATEYVLAGGRRCVIFQLQDDHSRLAVASLVARSETSLAAIEVVRRGITARGVPQRLLTDNGAAMNQSRQGKQSALVVFLESLGVIAMTGRPGRPTTQGKNERFHQTLFRWLEHQPLAASITELQEQVDRFDHIYNTQRPHQGLPGRTTPQTAWEATEVAEPPSPVPAPAALPKFVEPRYALAHEKGEHLRKVQRHGNITVKEVIYHVGRQRNGHMILATISDTTITLIDTDTGEVIVEDHPLPPAEQRYVGIRQLKPPQVSPMS